MDTCTTEFLFLLEFFLDPPPRRPLASAPSAPSSSTSPATVEQSTVMIDSFGSRQVTPLDLSLDRGSEGKPNAKAMDGQSLLQQRGRHNLSTNKIKLLFGDVLEKYVLGARASRCYVCRRIHSVFSERCPYLFIILRKL